MQRVSVVTTETEAAIAQNVCYKPTEYDRDDQNRKDQIVELGFLIDFLLRAPPADQNVANSIEDETGGQISYPSLRVIERLDVVGLIPAQAECLYG